MLIKERCKAFEKLYRMVPLEKIIIKTWRFQKISYRMV